MKIIPVFLLFIMNISLPATCQFNNLIIHTKPIRDAIPQNPNLTIEKIFSDHYGLELEGTWKRRTWTSHGGESFGGYFPSTGFRTAIGLKRYFTYFKPAPKTLYAGIWSEYMNFSVHSLDKNSFHGGYESTVDERTIGKNLLLKIGYSNTVLKYLYLGLEAGFGFGWRKYITSRIAGEPLYGSNPDQLIEFEDWFTGMGTITMGFFLNGKSKK
jgi:hypothetical protein